MVSKHTQPQHNVAGVGGSDPAPHGHWEPRLLPSYASILSTVFPGVLQWGQSFEGHTSGFRVMPGSGIIALGKNLVMSG